MKHKIVKILLILSALFLISSNSLADTRFSISYCPEIRYESWQSPQKDCWATELELTETYSKHIYYGLSFMYLASQITDDGHYIDSVWFEGDYRGIALSGRLGLRKYVGRFFCELYGGLGIMEPNIQPEIGDSGFVGHFGINLGVNFYQDWFVSYGLLHMSDPFRDNDKGWNFQVLKVGRAW